MFLGKTKTSIEGNEIVIRIQIAEKNGYGCKIPPKPPNPYKPEKRYQVVVYLGHRKIWANEHFHSLGCAERFFELWSDPDEYYKKKIVDLHRKSDYRTISHEWGCFDCDNN